MTQHSLTWVQMSVILHDDDDDYGSLSESEYEPDVSPICHKIAKRNANAPCTAPLPADKDRQGMPRGGMDMNCLNML